MEYRNMELINEQTSLLGFGCMRFPLSESGEIDENKAEHMLDRAMKAGINYYDTAYPYHNGKSEQFLGKVMKRYDRSTFYLATKLPVWMVENREDAERIFEEQLKNLQTDYVDFYLFHGLNKERWEKIKELKLLEILDNYKRQGKIHHLGFSFHDCYSVFEEIIYYRKWDFCQIQYNYMDTALQAGDRGYQLAEKEHIPLIIMEPVKGGFLASLPVEMEEKLRSVSPECSIASWALRWVAGHPQVKVVLSGMTLDDQLEDNLKTFEKFTPLSECEQKVLKEVSDQIRTRQKSPCTACRYCQPCPFGIKIPENFSAWNRESMFGSGGRKMYHDLGQSAAEFCRECGKCEKVCPQHIHIREDLKRAAQELR